MVKPLNVQNILRDKIIFGDLITLANASGTVILPFVDDLANHNWQVISVRFLVTTTYIAAQATSVSLGIIGTNTYFTTSQSLGTAQITANNMTAALTLGADVVLPSSTFMVVAWTQNASQSGVVRPIVRIRPQYVKWEATKRPQNAEAAV